MTNRRELADRLEDNADWLRDFPTRSIIDNKLSGVDGRGIDSVEVLLREAARLLREPVAGEVDRLSLKLVIGSLRRNRVSDYPGGPKVHDGLGWENLEEVVDLVEAIFRARLDDEGKGLPETPEGPIA